MQMPLVQFLSKDTAKTILAFLYYREFVKNPNATNKLRSLVMIGLSDVDGFKICIQVCAWLGFLPLMRLINRFFQNEAIFM